VRHIKDAYYFPHDSNARNDPKILDMISQYGMLGYGWFWVLVEMLREQSDYKLKLNKCNAYALQMRCTSDEAEKYIHDCIDEFDLLKSDGEYFWSESLIRRMNEINEKTEKRRKAALTRWSKSNADAMQMQCDAIKEKKSKVNNNNNIYTPEFEQFYAEYPRPEDKRRSFNNWKTQLKHYTVEQLMAACRNYKKAKAGTDKQYLKSSANFLGRERPFEDYINYTPLQEQSKLQDATNYDPRRPLHVTE